MCHFIHAGVIADEDIKAGSFVTEYKYDKTFPLKEKDKYVQEYATNEEGSYVLEAQLPGGQWICLDATRNLDCWARYINHAPESIANVRMYRPLQVDGQWRVAFLATRNISKGEEIFYDYGRQPNPPDFMRRNKSSAKSVNPVAPTQQGKNCTVNPETSTPTQQGTVNPETSTAHDEPIALAQQGTGNPETSQGTCQQCDGAELGGLCRECGELCANCIQQHSRMSSLKNHVCISIEQVKPKISTCGLCSGVTNSDAVYCTDCKAYLCHECKLQHSKMKMFFSHSCAPESVCPECSAEKTVIGNVAVCTTCVFKESLVSSIIIL